MLEDEKAIRIIKQRREVGSFGGLEFCNFKYRGQGRLKRSE
jgi:hypothetical protein